MSNEEYYDWNPDLMLEVSLPEPDNFLKIKETLTRIGIASKKDKVLYQSCLLLHKRGKYFVVHFKELHALDGKYSSLTVGDVERRNAIAALLEEWELLKIVNPDKYKDKASMSTIKIISFKEKDQWTLKSKYTIGAKNKRRE